MKITKMDDVLDKVKGFATPEFIIKNWWVWVLILITVFAFWTRAIPAKYGELQALDPFFAFRMNEYMLEHNLQLPPFDHMRYWPDGVYLKNYGPIIYFYVPVVLYVAFVFFGVSMPFLKYLEGSGHTLHR